VGLDVVNGPVDGSLWPVNESCGALVVERLSREKAGLG